MDSKPWYLSKGLIGGVIALAAGVLILLKRPDASANLSGETESIGIAIEQIVVVVGAVLAIIGRIFAKTTIGK